MKIEKSRSCLVLDREGRNSMANERGAAPLRAKSRTQTKVEPVSSNSGQARRSESGPGICTDCLYQHCCVYLRAEWWL
ncbi:hypothetical protein RJ55_03048 [Drechmeria coniospora]|nr:hypothetical protein RJ55_03048 [Drechmeria coniospora]